MIHSEPNTTNRPQRRRSVGWTADSVDGKGPQISPGESRRPQNSPQGLPQIAKHKHRHESRTRQ